MRAIFTKKTVESRLHSVKKDKECLICKMEVVEGFGFSAVFLIAPIKKSGKLSALHLLTTHY